MPMNCLWRVALRIAYQVMLAYWFVFRPETHGVYVAIWHGSRVLLIRNSYKPQQTFPAGGVKRGESDEAAAVRELKEEVGIGLEPTQLRFVGRYVSHAEFKTDKSVVFEARLDELPTMVIDQREVIHAEFIDARDACRRDLVPIVREYMTATISQNGW